MKKEYKEKGPNGRETGVSITIKVAVNEDELSDFIFKVRMEREKSISGVSLGKDLHIARAILDKYNLTEK